MHTNSFYLFELPSHNDERGKMCVGEAGKDIPFVIKRFFFDYNNSQTKEHRGNHANVNSQFVFVCVRGSCTIKVDDGYLSEEFVMNDPKKALYTDRMVWKEMYNYSKDSVLLVLSNSLYDSSEYIRDYDLFLKTVKGDNSK